MDNLNTHTGVSLYKTFPPALARELMDKSEFVHTPKHGSWLNHCRRLSKSYERLTRTDEAWVFIAMSRIMLNRLA